MPSNSQQNTLELFPEIEPFNNFYLPKKNMHEVYVEESEIEGFTPPNSPKNCRS